MNTDEPAQTIDQFIESFPKPTQKILPKLRQEILSVIPEAKEKISYGIPTFELNGKNIVHFSAYDKHVGFYPGSVGVTAFAKELKPYKTSKGTVRFPIDKPLPYDLIRKITGYCADKR